MTDFVTTLSQIIADRKANPKPGSYTNKLLANPNKAAEKVGEEAVEVIIAAKDARGDTGRAELVGEVADLWFHSMVMLSHLDVGINEVTDCLRARLGTSGIEEKAARAK